MMGKRMAALLLLAAAATAGWWYYRPAEGTSTGLEVSGTIEATQVDLCARLPGALERVLVQAGDTVQKGQLVAAISRSDLAAQKERDALAVAKAEAQLADVAAGARYQEIRDAEIGVSTAQANYDKAAKDHERNTALFKQGVIPASEVERSETALKGLQNQLSSARQRLSLITSGSRPEQIQAARTEVERSQAVLKGTEAALEDTKITSPISGTVLSKNFEPGEYVQPGAAVATVVNLSDMWIKVYIPTDDLPRVKLGQAVAFTVSGSPQVYQGRVREIATQGEYTPRMIQTKKERTNIVFAIKIAISDAGGALKPGMPADVVIE